MDSHSRDGLMQQTSSTNDRAPAASALIAGNYRGSTLAKKSSSTPRRRSHSPVLSSHQVPHPEHMGLASSARTNCGYSKDQDQDQDEDEESYMSATWNSLLDAMGL